jgi:hypothetical protein
MNSLPSQILDRYATFNMTHPYHKYKNSNEWAIVEKAINDLVVNKDLELTTKENHVIGYITKQLIDKKSESKLRTEVILSANRAMWGTVTPHLRGVTVDYNTEWLTLRAYFDNGATEDDKELIDVALTEMIADLWQDIEKCHYEPIDLPFPNKMDILKDWIYMRHENWNDINPI